MPSRKRTKGKERKAKKAEVEAEKHTEYVACGRDGHVEKRRINRLSIVIMVSMLRYQTCSSRF